MKYFIHYTYDDEHSCNKLVLDSEKLVDEIQRLMVTKHGVYIHHVEDEEGNTLQYWDIIASVR